MKSISSLNKEIKNCKKCPRLSKYIQEVAKNKVKRFANYNYYGKPLSGFGDINARLLIVGLAPAAHGGNRTGRMFTGDSSGDWLVKALYEFNLCNQSFSNDINDGLILRNVYITSIVKCSPPKNKPFPEEINNCEEYFRKELGLLAKSCKVFLTLGKLAFDQFCKIYEIRKIKFKHGLIYRIDADKVLISSYHPSRQNTNTGKLTWTMWINIFRQIMHNFL